MLEQAASKAIRAISKSTRVRLNGRAGVLKFFIYITFKVPLMNVVILAAGMGKRMQSALPKVLHPLAGKPLLGHVVDTAKNLAPSKLCVVYGHGGDAVPSSFADATLSFALQEPQLGTGHAVAQALPFIDDNASTLVLYGDVPLTTPATLQRLLAA